MQLNLSFGNGAKYLQMKMEKKGGEIAKNGEDCEWLTRKMSRNFQDE